MLMQNSFLLMQRRFMLKQNGFLLIFLTFLLMQGGFLLKEGEGLRPDRGNDDSGRWISLAMESFKRGKNLFFRSGILVSFVNQLISGKFHHLIILLDL